MFVAKARPFSRSRGCAHSPKVMIRKSLFLRSTIARYSSAISGKSFPLRTATTYCETLSMFDLPSISWSSPIAKSPLSPVLRKITLFRMDIVLRANLPAFGLPSIGWSSLIVKSPFLSVPREIIFISNGYRSSRKVLFPSVLTLFPS